MSILVHHRSVATRPRRALLARLLAAEANWRAARQMARLSDHSLCDVGLSRADIRAETARSGWSAPAHWRQDSQGPFTT